MKIAFVYDAVYPWVKGGAEKRIYEIGKRLAESGNDVHVFGIKWWDGEDVITYDGMTLHGVCSEMELYVNGKRSIKEALVFSLKLFSPLRREKFDIIDVSVFPYFSCFTVKLVSMLKKTPAVFTWHEFWGDYWYEYLGKKGFFGKMIEKLVYRISPYNIAVSEMTERYLSALGPKKNETAIIYNGIDLGFIQNTRPSEEKYDILFAGRHIKEKHADILLKAIAEVKKEIPRIKACIVGDGPEKENLEKLSKSLGIHSEVTFAGFLDYDKVIATMKSSDVFVLPSGREGFGIVVIEAFACGCPVITVNEERNASRYLVGKDCGIITELDEYDIARAILKLLKDETLREKITEHVVFEAGQYSWDTIIEKNIEYYRKMT